MISLFLLNMLLLADLLLVVLGVGEGGRTSDIPGSTMLQK